MSDNPGSDYLFELAEAIELLMDTERIRELAVDVGYLERGNIALRAEIERLRGVVQEVANAGVTFSDPRLDYVEIQLPDIVLVEAHRLMRAALAKEQSE